MTAYGCDSVPGQTISASTYNTLDGISLPASFVEVGKIATVPALSTTANSLGPDSFSEPAPASTFHSDSPPLEPSPPGSSSSQSLAPGIIAAIAIPSVLFGLALIALVSLVIWYCRQRRFRQQRDAPPRDLTHQNLEVLSKGSDNLAQNRRLSEDATELPQMAPMDGHTVAGTIDSWRPRGA